MAITRASAWASTTRRAQDLPILQWRLPEQTYHAFDYREPFDIGSARVSFHSAGHVLGSAQVRIEVDGEVWVVSGDYKRQPDPTCAPFDVVRCDTFITEATFGFPVYRWPHTSDVARDIVAWRDACAERGETAILYCYALGKSQRVLAELRRIHRSSRVHARRDRNRRAGLSQRRCADAGDDSGRRSAARHRFRRRTRHRAAVRRGQCRGCADSAKHSTASHRDGCAFAAIGGAAMSIAVSSSPITPTGPISCARCAKLARNASSLRTATPTHWCAHSTKKASAPKRFVTQFGEDD